MAAARFLCDEHVAIPVYRALADAGIDVAHVLALGLGGTPDPALFDYARQQGRILLTRNYRDFAPLVERWSRTGQPFPGVLFVATSIPQADGGAHVQALSAWLAGPQRVAGTYGWLR